MKMYKYILSSILLIIHSCLYARDVYDFTSDNEDGVTIYYTITSADDENLTCAVTCKEKGYQYASSNYSGNLKIPSFVTYYSKQYKVTSIYPQAFNNCVGLNSIYIPNTITSISYDAFNGCNNLKDVEIHTSSIESWFAGKSLLETIVLGEEVKTIEENAFWNCRYLSSIKIPSSVISIGNQAFYGCSSLTSIEIPNSVISIGDYVFSGCSSLSSIEIPNSVSTIGNYAFEDCSLLNSIKIGKSVTSIGSYAFEGCSNLKRVEIEDLERWFGISFEDEYSNPLVYGHSLNLNTQEIQHLVIPNTVTSINSYALYGATNLMSIEIPNSITEIGRAAFADCSGLTSIVIPNTVMSIGDYAFKNLQWLNLHCYSKFCYIYWAVRIRKLSEYRIS